MNNNFDISNLKKCINSLEVCINAIKLNKDITMKEFIEDSCIQRFEYTVETSIKTMRRFLKLFYDKNDAELTVNNIFRYMEGYGFIKSWVKWREYYNKRNDTAHEYNREKADKVLEYVEPLIEDTKFLYEKLSITIGENK